MSKLICNLLLVLASAALGAQSLTPEVVATTGETFSNSTVTIEWTLGEIMTESYTGSFVLTQGFHQPPGDVYPPIARCRENVVAQVDADGNVELAPGALDEGSSDTQTAAEDLDFSLNFNGLVLDCNAVGQPAQPVTLIVTDENGFRGSCTALVSGADPITARRGCRDTTVALDPVTGEANLLFLEDVVLYSASDNCRNLNIEVFIPTDATTVDCDDFYNSNTVPIAIVAEDESDNSASCTITVFVSDPSGACGGALPVEWLSFGANAGTKTVDLQWETTETPDNAGFHVERSATGSNWSVIGQVDARPNSDQRYASTDSNPLTGLSYYRIRQTDFDGRVTYSHVKTVRFFTNDHIVLYPNPATNEVNIQLPEGAELLGLLSVTGRATGLHFNGQNGRLITDVSGLPAGVYFLRVRLAGGRPVARRLVVR